MLVNNSNCRSTLGSAGAQRPKERKIQLLIELPVPPLELVGQVIQYDLQSKLYKPDPRVYLGAEAPFLPRQLPTFSHESDSAHTIADCNTLQSQCLVS